MSFVPFDKRDGWIWLDGEFVPWGEAKVHVLIHALHYGSCVFEGERMYNGEIFKLTEHTERLFRSAQLLDFEIPYTVAEIDEACKQTAARNGLTDCYLRPVAWRVVSLVPIVLHGPHSVPVPISSGIFRRPCYRTGITQGMGQSAFARLRPLRAGARRGRMIRCRRLRQTRGGDNCYNGWGMWRWLEPVARPPERPEDRATCPIRCVSPSTAPPVLARAPSASGWLGGWVLSLWIPARCIAR